MKGEHILSGKVGVPDGAYFVSSKRKEDAIVAAERVVRMDYYAMLKYARTLAASEGLSVEYFDLGGEGPQGPHTYRNKICLPKPNPLWSDQEWADWMDGACHEIGHNMRENRDGFDTLDRLKIDGNSMYGSFLNLIDDQRVDRSRCEVYRGMMEYHTPSQLKHVQDAGKHDWSMIRENKDAKQLLAMLAFDTECRQDWNRGLIGQEMPFLNQMDDECLKWYDKLVDKYHDRYVNLETSEDEVKLLDDILRDVFELDPEQEKKKAQAQAAKGEGSDSDTGKEKSDGQSCEAGEGEDSEGKGKTPKEDNSGKDRKVNYEEFLKHKNTGKDSAQHKSNIYIDYSDYSSERAYSPHTDSSTLVINMYKDKLPSALTGSRMGRTSKGEVETQIGNLNIPTMVAETRRLLQVKTRKRNFYNQKKGRLDTSKIYRVCSPDEGLQERIFKQKTESDALDTAVSVLVDYSGSMSGTKISVAVASAVALEQLCRMLRIPCEIAGFTEPSADENWHYIFKEFLVPVNDEKMIESMVQASKVMSNNADGDNILVAYNRLMQQRNKRKVLIVLSDGSPASGRGDTYGFTKRVVSGIEARHDVDIVGIGILDRNVTFIYTNNKVIRDLNQLPKALVETLEFAIIH